ncbi:Fungal specific transcription factor [Neonectria magnoliae]|uniref:Fungal specific transcription factor n=1 Tax=Neonectria magnoliae TaxID=2732573 RepID=A0ABR1IHQ7_9HYPO
MFSQPLARDPAPAAFVPMPNPAKPGGGGGGGGGNSNTGGGASASAASSSSSSSSRSRPCDTCRLRKTRCVKEDGQHRCVLCTFHNQPCTFLRGPTPRQRRLNRDRDRLASSRDANDDSYVLDSADTATSPPQQPGNGAPPGGSPSSSRQGDSASTPASVENNNPMTGQSPSRAHQQLTGPNDKRPEAPRPKILSNTLGLDLKTHAEYIGPTDYRDPFLLDLHRPTLQLNEDGSAPPSLSTYSRRLNHRTVFLVHPDESAASETRRLADLDAIEAAVHPLGRTLVDLYFRIVHPSFPILHKDVFISKHRLSHRHFAPSLLAAVYLVALDWQLYDSSLAGREVESIPDPAALEDLAERTMAQDMRRPKLSTLEAGLLLLQRNRRIVDAGIHTHPTSSRMFTAQLIAMAQDLGIHIDCSSWSIPAWEIGLRRRLAWALYMQDRWGACVHGRPFLIQDSDWDVQPCSSSDYPELIVTNDGSAENNNSVISTGWDLFLRHIELTHILSDVIRTFYSAAATRTGGTIDQMGVVAAVELAKPLVFRLREWQACLPHQLQLQNTKLRELCANGALHLAHASIEIALHRALVRIMTPETPENLYDVLRSTARAKLQGAIELLGSLRPEHTAAFWGSAAAYQAAEVGSLAGLLWVTADSFDEMAWCAARIDELRWALRVRGAAAPFAREALRLLEREIGGLGMVKSSPDVLS